MAKLSIVAGATSKLVDIFIQNSSSTTGAGLTGLVFNTGSLIAYYYREGAATSTAISLATMTLGTWATSGFIVIDGTNMPGSYQLGLPDAAIAAGAKSVLVMLSGAANMAPCVLEIELTAVNNQSATAFITGVNSLAPPAAWNTDIVQTGDAFARLGVAGVGLTNLGDARIANLDAAITTRTKPADTQAAVTVVTTSTNLTNAPTAGDFTAAMKTSLNAATPASVTGAVGSVTGAVGSVTGTVGSVTGAVGSVTGNVGGNVNGSVGSVVAGVTLTASQVFIKKNVQITITFPMTDSTTHLPATGLTVAARRSIDGAAVGNCANSVAELSLGLYSIVLAAGDVNGSMISLIFSAAAADTRFIGLVTQP